MQRAQAQARRPINELHACKLSPCMESRMIPTLDTVVTA